MKCSSSVVEKVANFWPGTWPNRGAEPRSSSASGSAAPARTPTACRARTRSGAPKWPTSCATPHGFGIVTGATAIDMKRVLAAQARDGRRPIAMHLDRYKASGAELIMGTGRFVAPKTIEVKLNDGGTRLLTGDRVVLNLGTHATIPDIPGLAAAEPLTNVEMLELDRLPDHLIVLGGGYVGLEFAQAYRRFGSRVTYRGGRAAARRPGRSRRRGRSSGDAARRRHRGASWSQRFFVCEGRSGADRPPPRARAGRRTDRRGQRSPGRGRTHAQHRRDRARRRRCRARRPRIYRGQ